MISANNIKVLLLDPMPAESIEQFKALNYAIHEEFDIAEGKLALIIHEYNLVCLSRDSEETILTDEILRSGHRLVAIGMFGTLKNQIDIPTSVSMGIPIFTSPYQHQTAVAELVISFIILLARQMGDRSMELHQGNWQKTSNDCHEVRGKTLGIIGYGHVGSSLGIMAEALSLKVIFYDTLANMPIGRAEPRSTMEQVLQEADFISIHVSTLPENKHMISEKEIAKMKKNSYLINCSFGDAVDNEALANAIKTGHLKGAGIDAHGEKEPKSNKGEFKSPLVGLPNVILTPHYGKRTFEAQINAAQEVQRSLTKYIKDGTTLGCVNFPSVVPWPLGVDCSRIVCLHHNVRGVVREFGRILTNYNVDHQLLDTMGSVGILVVDVATKDIPHEVVSEMASLGNTIRTWII